MSIIGETLNTAAAKNTGGIDFVSKPNRNPNPNIRTLYQTVQQLP